jgi:hypothetical protein
MTGLKKVFQVQFFRPELGHGSKVGKDVPRRTMMQQNGHARLRTLRRLNALRQIDPGVLQPIERERAHLIASDFAYHPYFAPKS